MVILSCWFQRVSTFCCNSRFSPGLKILQQESWGIFNLQSRIKDSPTRVLRNLQSSIFNPGLKILQQDSWGIFNLQSWIEDSRTRLLGNLQSLIFNLGPQVWGAFALEGYGQSLSKACVSTFTPQFVALGPKHCHSASSQHTGQDVDPSARPCHLEGQPGIGSVECRHQQQPSGGEAKVRLGSAAEQSFATGGAGPGGSKRTSSLASRRAWTPEGLGHWHCEDADPWQDFARLVRQALPQVQPWHFVYVANPLQRGQAEIPM